MHLAYYDHHLHHRPHHHQENRSHKSKFNTALDPSLQAHSPRRPGHLLPSEKRAGISDTTPPPCCHLLKSICVLWRAGSFVAANDSNHRTERQREDSGRVDALGRSKIRIKEAEARSKTLSLRFYLEAKLSAALRLPGSLGCSKPPTQVETEGSLITAFSQPEFHPTEPIKKDPTHTHNPYIGVDPTTSSPNNSWSPLHSPGLQQKFPQIPDGYGRQTSEDSLATLSPPPDQDRKPRATQADAVLINFLAPEHPQIAIEAGQTPLFWPSGSDNETEMEGGSDGHDGEDGGGGGSDSSRSVSRKHSTKQLNGGLREPNGGESSDGVGSGAAGEGGGDERKGNPGGGRKDDGGRGGDRGKGEDKDEGEDEDEDEEDPPTIGADEMEVDSEGEEFAEGREISRRDGEGTRSDRGEDGNGGVMVAEPSLTETAETAVSLIALAAGDDRQQFPSTTPLPEVSPKVRGGSWAPTGSKSPSRPQNRVSPSPSRQSSQLFHNKKLPQPTSPTSLLPSMQSQPASSPKSLPPGSDGRHTTLPSVSSITELAALAAKESPQQQSPWANNGMPPNPRTVYPAVSSHVSIAPSNRSAQAPQSPGLPPPSAHSPHGFGPNPNPRPPWHHMSMQQRQRFMNPDSPPLYSHHPHFQSPPSLLKKVAQPNGSEPSTAYSPSSFQHPRDLPGVMRHHLSPTANTNYFAQTGVSGRRDSTSVDYYTSEHTPPSGPSTGDTMASSGTDDTLVSSPRNRTGVASGNQGGAIIVGGFKCEYQGCKAPPFQTQYLLNSHANVHSSARPHYCPVKGCSRAEGGKGFKRKNEMIRHGLVHDSPGYVCPFCPDKEHKYPRPDNLQRHVRVHHMDKEKDDPQLRDVLAQRPEGGNRGRRRRLGS